MPTASSWLTTLPLQKYKKKFQDMSAGRSSALAVAAFSLQEAAPALGVGGLWGYSFFSLFKSADIFHVPALAGVNGGFVVCFNYTLAKSLVCTGQTDSLHWVRSGKPGRTYGVPRSLVHEVTLGRCVHWAGDSRDGGGKFNFAVLFFILTITNPLH